MAMKVMKITLTYEVEGGEDMFVPNVEFDVRSRQCLRSTFALIPMFGHTHVNIVHSGEFQFCAFL